MKKRVLTALAVGLCIAANTFAQVPSYVPTNGLVGWWPFNGNANDESGSNNLGTSIGAILSTDRYGNANCAYSFNGIDQYIVVDNPSFYNINQSITISAWIYSLDSIGQNYIVSKFQNLDDSYSLHLQNLNFEIQFASSPGIWVGYQGANSISTYQWYHLAAAYDYSSQTINLYLNGLLINQTVCNQLIASSSANLTFGSFFNNNLYPSAFFKGKIDDIGIWNRALTQQEITALYQVCNVTANASPTAAITATGNNAQFSTSAISGASYQWQSNPANYGWSNVPNNASYTGGTSNTLTVSNVQLANHLQPFRVIATDGTCSDTSNVAYIQVADTCITNITVTDTLIINTTLSLPAPNNQNTILIYPNPASDHITIDNGNYAAMAGYSIKIENNAGQQVFQSAINQTQFYIDLNTWTGNGLYFVHLIDPSGTTVTIRKIVLQ